MQISDLEKIDLLSLEILHDSEMYKIRELHQNNNYYRNPPPTGEEEFEDIDIDDLDELLEDQSLLTECLALWQSGYDAKYIAFELNLQLPYAERMLNYIKKNIKLKDKDRAYTIQNLYAKNFSVSEIAKMLKLRQRDVRQYLPEDKKLTPKKKTTKQLDKSVIKKQYSPAIKKRVLELCANTEMPYTEIAKITGVNRNTVNRWCKQKFRQQRRKAPLTQKQKEEIRILCRDTDMSLLSIGKKYDVSAQTVARICKDIPRKRRVASPAQKKQALTLIRTTDLTNLQIAEKVGVSDTTIRRWRRKVEEVEDGA